MNRSLTSFSESKKNVSLSYAFKHPFICAHLQSVTIFWELCAYISEQNGGFYFCLDYFLLHIPEQLLTWQEGTDSSTDLDNLWLWKLFKMFLNYFLFLYFLLYSPFFVHLGKCWSLYVSPSVWEIFQWTVFILREEWFLLQLLSKSQMQVIMAWICVWFSACVFLMF